MREATLLLLAMPSVAGEVLRAEGRPDERSAFSLVEMTLALGIAAFCLLTLFALLPAGLRSDQASVEQGIAMGFARAIVADLRAGSTNQRSPGYGLSITNTAMQTVYLSASGTSTSVDAMPDTQSASSASRYRASVFMVPPAGGSKAATMVRIQMTWPAVADPNPAAMPSRYTGSADILTAIDKN